MGNQHLVCVCVCVCVRRCLRESLSSGIKGGVDTFCMGKGMRGMGLGLVPGVRVLKVSDGCVDFCKPKMIFFLKKGWVVWLRLQWIVVGGRHVGWMLLISTGWRETRSRGCQVRIPAAARLV